VAAKATFQMLAKSFPGSQLILGIKFDPTLFGRIFVDVRVDSIIPCLGGISQERDDKADLVEFLE